MYRIKWAKNENVDDRVLADWEHEIIMCMIKYCKRKHTRIRKKQVLKNSKHLEYIKDFHEYVLVPTDKAANNIIVVCKKNTT